MVTPLATFFIFWLPNDLIRGEKIRPKWVMTGERGMGDLGRTMA